MSKIWSSNTYQAVLSAIAASTAATVVAPPVIAAPLDEIVVTATRRETTLQDAPLTVEAIDQKRIDELNIKNFDDYVRYLPNVTMGGRGPGQSEVYLRGMSIDAVTALLSGAQGVQPNVAIYLDEQPVTAPSRNLDVYTADLARIEVLAGPQGTLFGASSQAGTVRLITNKPDASDWAAGFDASYSMTRKGDPSNSLEAYINAPIIEDQLAVRGVFYRSKEGGYIDNVASTFTPDPSVNPTLPANNPAVATYQAADNAALVEDDFNEATYTGYRIAARWDPTEDLTATVTFMNQQLDVDGVFDVDPTLGDLEVARFFEDELEDDFYQASWTLEGRFEMLDVIYAGSFLERDITQSVDYTGYNNVGGFIAYYTCTYAPIRQCLDPTKGFLGKQEISRQTHEIRVTTPEDNRWGIVAGVFYDDFELETRDEYAYVATPQLGFFPNAPIATANNIDNGVRPAPIAFYNDITRTEQQIAVFGEFSYDVLDSLTLAVGARWYDIESDFEGSSNFANGPFQPGDSVVAAPAGAGGRDYDRSFGHTGDPLDQDDLIFRFTASYTTPDENLAYFTWSEGFRPGGWNRGGGAPSNNPTFPTVPVTYDTDEVTNWEIGYKAVLMDGAMSFNAAAYFVEWEGMQVARFDPVNVSILTFIDNSADAEILGMEANVVWALTDGLTLYGAFSYNDTELKSTNSQVIELVPVGSTLALAPKYQVTARARYEWTWQEYDLFAQLGIQHSDDANSSIVVADRRAQDDYATVDFQLGARWQDFGLSLFVENVTDQRAQLFFNVQDDSPRITTNRPRTIGVRFSYDFGE